MRMLVRSLASLSGLRIRHCHELWCRSQTQLRSGIEVAVVKACGYSSDSTLSPKPLYAADVPPPKKGKKKKVLSFSDFFPIF